MKRGCPELHHLFFADNSLYLIQETTPNTWKLKSVIYKSYQASSQRVNAGKSSLYFNVNSNDENMSEFERRATSKISETQANTIGFQPCWEYP